MQNNVTPRANISEHIIETADGSWVLLKDPINWKEGETVRTASSSVKGVDIREFCAVFCKDTGIQQITFDQMYQICEVMLQMEEAGKEVFPK
jgi:hypothetical protein